MKLVPLLTLPVIAITTGCAVKQPEIDGAKLGAVLKSHAEAINTQTQAHNKLEERVTKLEKVKK